jgi:hypothetical protein
MIDEDNHRRGCHRYAPHTDEYHTLPRRSYLGPQKIGMKMQMCAFVIYQLSQ